MATLESEAPIKRNIKNFFDKHHCFHCPYVPYLAKAGMPDRIVFIPVGNRLHVVLFVEVKRPGKDLTPNQKQVKKEAEGYEIHYFRAWNVQDVKDYIEMNKINLIKKEKKTNE